MGESSTDEANRYLADVHEAIRAAKEAARHMADVARRLVAPNEDLIWHLRDGSWHRVDYDDWFHFRAVTPEVEWAPLPDVRPGDQHFVYCVIEDGRLYNMMPHRYLIDDACHIVSDEYFGVLSADEIERYESLGRRYLAWPPEHPLTDDERRELDAFSHRVWLASLPSPAAIRELMRVQPAFPGDDAVGVWKVLEASGFPQWLDTSASAAGRIAAP